MDPTIRRATEKDYEQVVHIGRMMVEESHRDSCSAENMNEFLQANYSDDAIKAELANTLNVYHLIYYNGQAVGFSKLELNTPHINIAQQNVTKLDRIYLLSEFHHLGLGNALMQHNINLSKQSGQAGIWLFTWTGNEKAIQFYKRTGFTVVGTHRFKVTDTHYNPNHHMYLRYA